MSAFADLVQSQATVPPRVIPLPASVWNTEYKDRPREETEAGLRRHAVRDTDTARAEASRHAWNMHPEPLDGDARTEAFNDALMRWLLARILCQPDNALEPLLDQQDDAIHEAFNDGGIRYLWSKVEEWAVEESPLVRMATVSDVDHLVVLLADGALERLPRARAVAVRRYLGAAIVELEAAGEVMPEDPEPPPDDEEEEEID